MYKQVDIDTSKMVEEFNAGGMYRLRRHCIVHGTDRDNTTAVNAIVAMVGAISMGWCQGVYGPLPAARPEYIAVLEYTGAEDGVMLLPVHADGTPYEVPAYDDVEDTEYCIWMDTTVLSYDEVMKYVQGDSLISLCRECGYY